MYKTILVPTDGSEAGETAVEHAIDLADTYGGSLQALFVVDTRQYSEPAIGSVGALIDEVEAFGAEQLQKIVETAEERGVPVEKRLCHGVPEQAIVEVATSIDTDLIVMGYQGQTHARRIGSTVDHVLRDTDRPVLTV